MPVRFKSGDNMLTTTGLIVVRSVQLLADVFELFLVARAILSWFPSNGGTLYKIYGFLYNFTEPIVAPFRKLLSRVNTGMFDFSVVLAFFAIAIAERILIYIAYFIF